MVIPKHFKMLSVQKIVGDDFLRSIKQYLMSRDIKLQIEAVDVLISYLKIDTANSGMSPTVIADKFLNADIAEFLGEAMATQHYILLNKIFMCLELLCASEKFFAHNHIVCYVLECLLRSIYFLLQKCEEPLTLSGGLNLLAIIFCGYDRGLPLNSACNILHVLELMNSILKQEFSETETVLAAGLVLNALLLHGQLDLILCIELPVTVKKCFNVLSQLVSRQDVATKAVTLIAKIGHAVIRSFDINMEVDMDEYLAPTQDLSIYKEKVLQSVVECIQLVCAPYIVDEVIDNCNAADMYYSVIICINDLYQESSIDHKQLSHKLASLGYIMLLPLATVWAVKRKEEALQKASMYVLGEFLVSLSQSALGVDSYWPGGFLAFKTQLMKAVHTLPPETEMWLHILLMKGAPQFYKDVIIIYYYFFLLFLPSPLDYDLNLCTLTSYILQLSSPFQYPTPIVKALWFIFTMSVLSGQASVPKGQLHEATKVLVTILDKSGDPRIVYTHHPAILFWAFSSYNINLKLQIIVMSLWLENEDGSSNVQVMHLILANPDASFCLLDIIQQGAPKIVEQATHILSKAIEYEGKKGAEDLIVMLWDTLPLVLAKYNSRSNLMEPVNLINFIRVACTSIPSAPSTTTIFRTASLLISLLTHKSDHSELTAIAMQLALHLLVVSVKLKDERVLTLYVTHEHFLETLKQGVEKTDTILPSLKLLTHILQLQHNYKIWSQQQLKRHCRVGIEAGQLLSLLASKDISILTLSLQVLYLLLESKLPSPTIRIMMQGSEVVSTRFVQVYFLKLQNLCLMNLPGITNSSWKCMGSVLFYAANCHPDPKLMPLLATQPWTHMLIRFTVPTKDAELSCECLYFLCQWLQYYNVNSDTVQYGNLRKSRGKSRAPYPDLLSISVNRLAPVLMMTADINITTQRTQLILLVISMILGPITELEPEIEAALKQKLLDSKVISK